MVKNLPAMRETWVRSLGGENPLEKGMAFGTTFQYSCLENSMERGAYWATVHGVTRIGHGWVTNISFNFYLKIADTAKGTPCMATIHTVMCNRQHGSLLSLMTCSCNCVLEDWENSRSPLEFTVQRPMVWWLWKLRTHQRKGPIKMHCTIIVMIIAILYSPLHSLLPVITISKDHESQKLFCVSQFGDGSSKVTKSFSQVLLHNGVRRLQ